MNSSHTTSSTTWKIDRIKWDVCRTFTFPVKRNLIKRSINFKHGILNQSRKSKPSPCLFHSITSFFEEQKYKISPYSQYKYSYNLIHMVSIGQGCIIFWRFSRYWTLNNEILTLFFKKLWRSPPRIIYVSGMLCNIIFLLMSIKFHKKWIDDQLVIFIKQGRI